MQWLDYVGQHGGTVVALLLMDRPTASDPLTILVVSAYTAVCDGLTTLLYTDPGLKVIGTAQNMNELEAGLLSLKPHVILLDIGVLPDDNDMERIRKLGAHCILLLVNEFDNQALRATLHADGATRKGMAAQKFLQTIWRTHHNQQNQHAG
ncbi:MAG: response regulator transcription factor [Anaerolineae bacterium]|nr:response regulator transcription factor [Anaerolineae bacterium]